MVFCPQPVEICFPEETPVKNIRCDDYSKSGSGVVKDNTHWNQKWNITCSSSDGPLCPVGHPLPCPFPWAAVLKGFLEGAC